MCHYTTRFVLPAADDDAAAASALQAACRPRRQSSSTSCRPNRSACVPFQPYVSRFLPNGTLFTLCGRAVTQPSPGPAVRGFAGGAHYIFTFAGVMRTTSQKSARHVLAVLDGPMNVDEMRAVPSTTSATPVT